MIELIFYDDLNFWETTKNNSWLPHVQQESFQRDPQLQVFPQILKEKKNDELFSKSKKSLLRNTKSNKVYILGVRWFARLAFVRRMNRRARAIACLLLTGLCLLLFLSLILPLLLFYYYLFVSTSFSPGPCQNHLCTTKRDVHNPRLFVSVDWEFDETWWIHELSSSVNDTELWWSKVWLLSQPHFQI